MQPDTRKPGRHEQLTTLRTDKVREKADRLAVLYTTERGALTPRYKAIALAVEEALARRSQAQDRPPINGPVGP